MDWPHFDSVGRGGGWRGDLWTAAPRPGVAVRASPPAPASSEAPVTLPKLPAVQGMVCEQLRLALDSGLDWRKLSRVSVNFENQTFPESLRLHSERSKPPLLPHARLPSLRLASQLGCMESKERREGGGGGSIVFPSQPSLALAGSFRSRSLEKVGPRRPLVQLPTLVSCQGQDFARAPHSCLPRVKGSLDVRSKKPCCFL